MKTGIRHNDTTDTDEMGKLTAEHEGHTAEIRPLAILEEQLPQATAETAWKPMKVEKRML